jgi:ribosomal protein L35AE/L33A
MFRKSERDERKLVRMTMRLTFGGIEEEVTIANISRSGLLFRSDLNLTVGDEVRLVRRGAVIEGKIVRIQGRRFAIKANKPIDISAVTIGSGIKVPAAGLRAKSATRLWHWRSRG